MSESFRGPDEGAWDHLFSSVDGRRDDRRLRRTLGSGAWLAHAWYNDFRHFFRAPVVRVGISDAYQDIER